LSHAARASTPPASADGAPSPQVPQVREVWIRTAPETPICVFGLTGVERLRRTFDLLASGEDGRLTGARIHQGEAPPSGLAAASAAAAEEAGPAGEARVLAIRGDAVYDERVVTSLLEAPGTALAAEADASPLAAHVSADQLAAAHRWLEGGPPPRGVHVATPAELTPAYTSRLRKTQPPFAFVLRRGDEKRAEAVLFEAAYKGVTDLVTRYVWPLPARWLTAALARAGVTPNAVTAASWVLVLGALAAFAAGAFGAGLVLAWLMTFLDTVDGKLARVTLRSSRVGHVLDHGLDLVHPPFWYAAWGVGLAAGGPAWIEAVTWIAVVGYVAGRLEEGIFLARFGFEIHSWRPLDSRFRLITARRNPNLVLLSAGTLVGRPDLGLAAVAAWTLASLGVHAVRLVQAWSQARRGDAVQAWQAAIGGAAAAETT